ncbi:hypothetical protein NAL32_17705 [Chryseobacterium sp. Ch-15]|uniref:Outer membrane protein beta-barrel domain-containing protein n=1 Tax=Chryseobacterium muglaense TaxID=2893752 RepID=A0A9Q3UUL7_9FLAO|nr:hypothetical protein [Chryseobacterium muglaense]MBD3906515.1 hypothetical protein [Chryseobacterium muglaense]MCC9034020.1 hypothetical protein [Chryseobacterium muglaense]MCM2556223.1 hypothetical protein [Chryseobacterium muglaense]
MIVNNKKILIVVVMALSLNLFSQNNETNKTKETIEANKNSWHFKLEANLMLPKAHGKTGVANYPNLDIDQKASDIYHHISYGGMYTFEASNDKWVIATDFIYSSLDASAKETMLVRKGKVNADQFITDVSVLRKITPWLDAGVGGTTVHVKAGFDAAVVNPFIGQVITLDRSISRTWVEPMIIARTTSSSDRKFMYTVRGGVGGFGIGSKFSWQAEAYAGYRFSEFFYASLGYRALSFNYKNGNNENAFLYDMTISGPTLKLGFNMDKLF